MSFRDRLDEGTPLRFGELARLLGYSREQIRKWANAGALETVRPIPGAQRRVTVGEAERIGRKLRLL